jgi:hypothetical protein
LNIPIEDKRLKNKPITKIEDFEMFLYNNTKETLKYFNKKLFKWEFAVPRQGFYDYNIKIYDEKQLNHKIQRLFFKPNTELARKILYAIDFNKLSKKILSFLDLEKQM